jgi:p25-alpha
LDRLTDTSKYGGTHRQRFDSTGKGRAKEGREDVHANDGYVTGSKIKPKKDKPAA